MGAHHGCAPIDLCRTLVYRRETGFVMSMRCSWRCLKPPRCTTRSMSARCVPSSCWRAEYPSWRRRISRIPKRPGLMVANTCRGLGEGERRLCRLSQSMLPSRCRARQQSKRRGERQGRSKPLGRSEGVGGSRGIFPLPSGRQSLGWHRITGSRVDVERAVHALNDIAGTRSEDCERPLSEQQAAVMRHLCDRAVACESPGVPIGRTEALAA
eukprot:3479630-Amphidinium_carterae.1